MNRRITTALAGISAAAGVAAAGLGSGTTAHAYNPCPFLNDIIGYHLMQTNFDFADALMEIGAEYGCSFDPRIVA